MPTNKELEEMGFNLYAEQQKADTLSRVPKIDLTIQTPIADKMKTEVIEEPVRKRYKPKVSKTEKARKIAQYFHRDWITEENTEPYKPTVADLPTNPLEDFINDYKADGFTFQDGVLTKHTHVEPTEYPFLSDLKDTLDVLLKADLDLSAIQNVAELILENGLRKVYREVNK